MSAIPRTYRVYGFASVHDALSAESVLKSAGIEVTAIPAPRELGELCGVALRVEPDRSAAVDAALAAGGISPRAIATIEDV